MRIVHKVHIGQRVKVTTKGEMLEKEEMAKLEAAGEEQPERVYEGTVTIVGKDDEFTMITDAGDIQELSISFKGNRHPHVTVETDEPDDEPE